MARAKPKHEAPAGPREVPAGYHDDAWVEIYPGPGLAADTARALLDTAEQLGYDPARAVVSISSGFRVPADVLDATNLPTAPSSDGHQTVHTPLAALEKGASPGGA